MNIDQTNILTFGVPAVCLTPHQKIWLDLAPVLIIKAATPSMGYFPVGW